MKIPVDLDTLVTLGDWLRWLTTELGRAELHFGHGTTDAWDEALLLLCDALELPPDRVNHLLATRLLADERALILERARRRIEERVPAAYLSGRAWYRGQRFEVSPDVLIPRSPIGELLDQHLTPWLSRSADAQPTRILDLCCGGGCLGIIAAIAFPEAKVVLADNSRRALAVARRNVARFHLQERVRCVESDLFKSVRGRFDVIVCNPPYVPASSYARLPAEYRHEPEVALVAADAGMALVREILVECAPRLTPQGILVLEVGEIAGAVERELAETEFVWAELEGGGEGVLILTRDALLTRKQAVKSRTK